MLVRLFPLKYSYVAETTTAVPFSSTRIQPNSGVADDASSRTSVVAAPATFRTTESSSVPAAECLYRATPARRNPPCDPPKIALRRLPSVPTSAWEWRPLALGRPRQMGTKGKMKKKDVPQ